MRVLLLVCFLIGSALAFDKPDKGWFFYEDPEKPKKETVKKVEKKIEKPKEKKKEKPKKVEKPKPKPQPQQVVKKKKEDKFVFPVRPDAPQPVKEFLLNPNRETAEKFLAWQYQYFQHLQKIGFALREAYLAKGPQVYPIRGYPESELASKLYFNDYRKHLIAKAIKRLKNRFGLIIFYSGKCKVCQQELPILLGLRQIYGITMRAVNVDGNMIDLPIKQVYNPQLAKQYGITRVPTVVAVLEKKDGTVKQSVVGVGLMTADTILSMITQFLILEGEIKGSELNFYFSRNVVNEVK
ncbi:hypothetical protein PERMA_A0033 (plasmid) [Persephonella marina EX-H1]|uniref:Conjugal transfer protein TraF n=1 Tax=Persephonella marina (strain DSM 14350 / EX-H1) TaxID=123214 RepID=C0QUW2_PERMH|nr:conjugal transfer protein TraF [Persephonella marina]ACO05000.1 hypothetical protein PERMA_A0033 [Persephonella marina EX-H1]